MFDLVMRDLYNMYKVLGSNSIDFNVTKKLNNGGLLTILVCKMWF
jgi:uncharacterized phage-associated protein